jgi:hypothetical protein
MRSPLFWNIFGQPSSAASALAASSIAICDVQHAVDRKPMAGLAIGSGRQGKTAHSLSLARDARPAQGREYLRADRRVDPFQ